MNIQPRCDTCGTTIGNKCAVCLVRTLERTNRQQAHQVRVLTNQIAQIQRAASKKKPSRGVHFHQQQRRA